MTRFHELATEKLVMLWDCEEILISPDSDVRMDRLSRTNRHAKLDAAGRAVTYSMHKQ
jgi:hypothetical protein